MPFTERRRSAARADGTAALLYRARSNGSTKYDCGKETFLSYSEECSANGQDEKHLGGSKRSQLSPNRVLDGGCDDI